MIDLILNAGHGGIDPGAIGPTKLQEKDVVLKVVKKVGALLKAQGFSIGYTRTTDIAQGLDLIADIANKAKATEFISIHANSASAPAATGTEVFSYKAGGTAAKLAADLLKPLVAAVGKANRGIKTANFAVLRETNMAAALVEIAFISNPAEEALLKGDAFLDRVALAIAVGYCTYKGKMYKSTTVIKPAAVVTPAAPTAATGYVIDLTKKLEAAQDEVVAGKLREAALVVKLEGANNKLTAIKHLANTF